MKKVETQIQTTTNARLYASVNINLLYVVVVEHEYYTCVLRVLNTTTISTHNKKESI